MEQALVFFANCFNRIIQLFDSYVFTLFNMRITLLDIFLTLVIISMVITLYWKGAKG